MTVKNIKTFLIEGKRYIDVKGVAELLGKSVGTIHNTSNKQGFPESMRKGRKIYFIKEEVEKYKKNNEIIEEN